MKILYVLHHLGLGGAERFVYQLSQSFSTEHEIGICCLDSRGSLWKDLEKKNIKLFCIDRKPGLAFANFQRFHQIIKEWQPDLVHAQHYSPFFYAAIEKLFYRSAYKLIFTEHGRHYPDIVGWKRKLANRFLYHQADEITAVSRFTKNCLVEKDGFSESGIKVIYNGVPLPDHKYFREELRKEFDLAEDNFVIGTIGTLRPIKNPILLLSAFLEVWKMFPYARLIYIGDGSLRSELEEKSQKWGIADHVLLPGAIHPADHYASLFDVFVLPSLCEAASLSLLEAMGRGVPTIVSDGGGSPELVQHMQSGQIVPVNDTQALVKALSNILENPERFQGFAKKAKEAVHNCFSFERMRNDYAELYKYVLNGEA